MLPAAAYGETSSAKEKEYIIKIATIAPEGTTWMDIMHDFEYLVKRTTGDRVKFVWYAGGVMGDELETVKKLKLGKIDGGGFTGLGLGNLVPGARILELPMLFKNYNEVDYTLGKLESTLRKFFEDRGYIHLGWAEQGFIYVFTNKPVHTLDDLKGIKMWIWAGDPLAKAAFDSLGNLTPIPIAVPEVLASLEAGKIDAFYNTPLGTVAFQWQPRVKYMVNLPLVYGTGALVMTKKVFDMYPPEIKSALLEGGKKVFPRLIASVRRDNAELLSNFHANGIEIITPDSQAENDFREKMKVVYTKLTKELYPEWLLTRVVQTLDEYRRSR